MIGFALTGSFCTVSKCLSLMERMVINGYEILPIMSENLYSTDTRFGAAKEVVDKAIKISKREVIHTIHDAEPLGPSTKLEAMVICPCTGNTLAKIANGITDTAVCMAAKAHLRNDRPLIIALASNDALSANLKNIGTLLTRKNVYFVPMQQDDPQSKPHSLVAEFDMLPTVIEYAFKGKQYPKIFL